MAALTGFCSPSGWQVRDGQLQQAAGRRAPRGLQQRMQRLPPLRRSLRSPTGITLGSTKH